MLCKAFHSFSSRSDNPKPYMQKKDIFYFHFDIYKFENKVASEKNAIRQANLPGVRLLWNALLCIYKKGL